MLGILIHGCGDQATLRCRGSIVAGRGVRILRAAVRMRREKVVNLDLAQVSALDAAGIGLLVELHHAFNETGRRLRFVRVSPEVGRTIRLVNLERVLNFPGGHAVAA